MGDEEGGSGGSGSGGGSGDGKKEPRPPSTPTSPVPTAKKFMSIPLVQGKLPTTAPPASGPAAAGAESNSSAPPVVGDVPLPLDIPCETLLAITEDEPDACFPIVRWTGTVGSARHGMSEPDLPKWLSEALLRNVVPVREPVKIGFLLSPAPSSNLAELRSRDQRLLANRMVRVRRILAYICENSDLHVPAGKPVEHFIELIIGGAVIDPMATLASVKTYHWRGGVDGDLRAWYRLVGSSAGNVPATKVAAAVGAAAESDAATA